MAWSHSKVYLAYMVNPTDSLHTPAWRLLPGLTDYVEMLAEMESHVDRMTRGEVGEEIWLVEHPPVLTAGTSTKLEDLLQPDRFPVIATGRGGQFTYHGPGQRVLYPMLDLSRRGRDVRRYVSALEAWAIAALGDLGIEAGTNPAGTGIWVVDGRDGKTLKKIGAIGVRVRRWISFHGMALNVSPDLSHYDAIVPCGISEHGITCVSDIREGADMASLDAALFNRLPILLQSLSADPRPLINTLEAAGDCS